MAKRSPCKKFGNIEGNWTSVKRISGLAPKQRPDMMCLSLIVSMPSSNESHSGKNELIATIAMAGVDPIPKNKIATGVQAIGGIGRINSKMPTKPSIARLLRRPKSPRKIAAHVAIKTPQRTRINECCISCHRAFELASSINAARI